MTGTVKAIRRHLAKSDWPHRDPPGWCFWGRALDRVAEQLHGLDGWRRLKDGWGISNVAERDFASAASLMIDWVLAGSLPFQARDKRGRTFRGDDHSVWLGDYARETSETGILLMPGTWGAIPYWLDVDLNSLRTQLAVLADEAERARTPQPRGEALRQWVKIPETQAEMRRRLESVGTPIAANGRYPRADRGRTLLKMWRDTGSMTGTPDTIKDYLEQMDLEEDTAAGGGG